MDAKKNAKKLAGAAVITVVAVLVAISLRPTSASADNPGDSAVNPVVLASIDVLPEGAVEDKVSTYVTDAPCDTTRSWTLTTPGQHHDEVTHIETRWSRVVPGSAETFHFEYKWKKVIHHDEVVQTKPHKRFSWNPKGPKDETNGPPNGSTPLTDPSHWQANTSHYNGTDPLGEVFQQGGGHGGDNASWFYWTTKQVVVEEAWDEVVWYNDGQWTTDVLDAPWIKVDSRSVGNGDAVPDKTVYWSDDGDTDTLGDANWSTFPKGSGPEGYTFVDDKKVVDKDGYDDPDTVKYYAWTDGKECDTSTPTPLPSTSTEPSPSETPTTVVPSPTTPAVTPPTKSTPATGGYVWPHTGA